MSLGVALMGSGAISDIHVRAVAAVAGLELVSLWSRTPEAALRRAREAGCRAVHDEAEVFTDPRVELVTILTSSGSHARLARAALRAGKHVLIEKPMAMSLADCETLIAEAKRCDRVLSVVSQRRFEPQHLAAKRVLETGALGKLLWVEAKCPYFRTQAYYDSASWRGTWAEDGGALMNQAIHAVDLLLWLAGPADSLVAETATQTHDMEAEDLALVLARLRSGAFASVMASTSICPGFPPTLAFHGEKGSLCLAGTRVTAWHVPGVEAPLPCEEESVRPDGAALPSARYHQAQYEDLREALRAGRPPLVTAEQGAAAVAFVEAAYESSRRGGRVSLPPRGGDLGANP